MTTTASTNRLTTIEAAPAPGKLGKLTGRFLIYLTLTIGAIVISLPWTWMILSSLKSNIELHSLPLTFWPKHWIFTNYIEAFFPASGGGTTGIATESIWPRLLANTLIIAFFVEVGTLISSALVAFSFSHMRWKGRNTVFVLVLATMMLPSQVTLIPQYLIFTKLLSWTNTWYPQIVPAFFGSAWAIFLLRQFMMTIPVEIDEAARLDGCNDLQLFWHIILPMSRPALGAIAIFTFTYVWNDLFTPLLYIRDGDMGNMATGMAAMRASTSLFGDRFPRDDLAMAAAVIVSLPLVIMFFIFQKQYIQGVVITGVK
jgi:ABC-type glycerol-3-phosphate transport system permease component